VVRGVRAGLPRDIVHRLNAEVVRIVTSQKVLDRYAALGLDAATSSPEALGTLTGRDLAKWTRVIKERGIKPE
jgi:tripartite-type tricarboxylate transporter receptor subunit TctC